MNTNSAQCPATGVVAAQATGPHGADHARASPLVTNEGAGRRDVHSLQFAAGAAAADWFTLPPRERTKRRLVEMVQRAVAREWSALVLGAKQRATKEAGQAADHTAEREPYEEAIEVHASETKTQE
jgi:hypothetical protein